MPISFRCTGCQTLVQVREEFAGQKVRCAKCQAVLTAPGTADVQDVLPASDTDPLPLAQAIQAQPVPAARAAAPPRSRPRRRDSDPDDRSWPEVRREGAVRRKSISTGLTLSLIAGGFVLFFLGSLAFGAALFFFGVIVPSSSPPPPGSSPPIVVAEDPPAPVDNNPPAVNLPVEELRNARFNRPPRNAAPVTYLQAVSSPGDYIGQGKTYSYRGNELTVQQTQRGVMIRVDGWHIEFGGPRGQFLQVGEYRQARRHAFSDNAPGIDFSGNGRGCNQISGDFVVWELEVKGDQIVRLAIDFVQRCEGTMPPLCGRLRINSWVQ